MLSVTALAQLSNVVAAVSEQGTMQSVVDNSPRDCLTCRVIGTGALGLTGIYALNQARPHAPGSLMGKRLIGATGVVLLVAAVMRWNAKPKTADDLHAIY